MFFDMDEWVSFSKSICSRKEGLILGCDWYTGEKKNDFRIMVCELPFIDAYWCGDIVGKCLPVFKSICPSIGHGHNPHWMEIPEDGFISFNEKEYPFSNSDFHEVLIKLKNGNLYTGFIELTGLFSSWCPSFNMMKHGDYNDIDSWRELPTAPAFTPKPPLTAEQKKKEKEFLKQFDKLA